MQYYYKQHKLMEVSKTETSESMTQVKSLPNSPLFFEDYQRSRLFIIQYLSNIRQIVMTDETARLYFQKIQLQKEEIQASFERIIQSIELAHKRAQETTVMRHGLGRSWILIERFLQTKNISILKSKEKALWILQVEAKLIYCTDFFQWFKQDPDITNSPRENYNQVWDKIKIEPVHKLSSLQKDVQRMKNMMNIAVASVLNKSQNHFQLIKQCSFCYQFLKYLINADSALLHSIPYYRKPTAEMVQKIWNLSENGVVGELSKLTFQGIATNTVLYLPSDGVYNEKINILKQAANSIKVRVIYRKKMKISPFSMQKEQKNKQKDQIQNVLLHIHGGGFLSQSSSSSQIITRKWANGLDVPIFSVDYRMPPDHPFPQAPLDCYAVYQFLLNHAHKYMSLRPSNIFVTGDSSGGNIALSLTGLILKRKQPAPKGVYAIYPVVDLRYHFTESKLYSLDQVLLIPSILNLCPSEYVNNDLAKAEDPLASPILMSEQYVNGTAGDKRFPLNWPKTIVTVGSKDPLLDDALLLMQKMVESKIDCECIIYEELFHGYLFCSSMVEQAKKTLKQSIEHLKGLIESSLISEEKKVQ